MRLLPTLLLIAVAAQPVAADETVPSGPEAKEGLGLIERGARIILESLLGDVQPKLDEMHKGLGEALAEMGPALKELLAKIDDFRNYHPPEMLPNGDIIIRRKSPDEIATPRGEIEL